MRVPARVFASEKIIEDLFSAEGGSASGGDGRSLDQLVNVSTLPGIQKWTLAMPDIHEGYGFQ